MATATRNSLRPKSHYQLSSTRPEIQSWRLTSMQTHVLRKTGNVRRGDASRAMHLLDPVHVNVTTIHGVQSQPIRMADMASTIEIEAIVVEVVVGGTGMAAGCTRIRCGAVAVGRAGGRRMATKTVHN
jgi:hypothetical protein